MRYLYLSLFFSMLLLACQNDQITQNEPNIDISGFELKDDFKIELIASEPLIEAPIAMSFDNEGRIWVVEMPDYMPNIDGAHEDVPRGRIVILEDQNGNGRMDKAKVFLDSLSQPRALAHVYGGLLFAEAPNLWFVDIEDDLPVNWVLVDSTYAVGGNVEHQPNGLLMNIDNWIYNAKSNFRYRRKDGVWEKEPTTFRGQWGITKNDLGHLFYNDNSNPLYGDNLMPALITRNPYQHTKAGESQLILKNRRLYPLQSTAVNRGYQDGMLDEENKLLNFTSACGPVIYSGAWEEINGDAFVCAPEANLIKRIQLDLTDDGYKGTYAFDTTEFLATLDEGFRPVNLNNAPDGDLYITDFHRGIIQHKVYMTAYLKKQIEDRQLDTIVGAGRIYRVYKEAEKLAPIAIADLPGEGLCAALYSKKSWLRDRAQQLLVASANERQIKRLKMMVVEDDYVAGLHALWALEGSGVLDFETLMGAIRAQKKMSIVTDYQLFSQFESSDEQALFDFYKKEIENHNTNKWSMANLAMSISACQNQTQTFPLLKSIAQAHPEDGLVVAAIISGLSEKEVDFSKYIQDIDNELLKTKLQQTITNRQNDKLHYIYKMTEIGKDDKTVGRTLFNIHCASCHGIGGEGNALLAPSLLQADLVEMDAQVVASIILHGLKDPITQNGELKTYNAAMPGLSQNNMLSDNDIAAITAYVKNAFSLSPQGIAIEKVKTLRTQKPTSGMWTEQELKEQYE